MIDNVKDNKIQLNNSEQSHSLKILTLGNEFYDVVQPAKFPMNKIRYRNEYWSQKLNYQMLSEEEWINKFAKFQPIENNLQNCLALRYHGHQFRVYNPDIGDGRGFLYAQFYLNKIEKDWGMFPIPNAENLQQVKLMDLGTKGSGKTPYSRFGDGRLTLKGGIREVLCTEMLEALGVNTSKSLSLIETGETLYRHDEEPNQTRSSVLVRLSHSHIRFGTFQRFAFFNKQNEIKQLVKYCLENYYQDKINNEMFIKGNQIESHIPEVQLLKLVSIETAKTFGQLQAAGFVHGVLNTDNMNITGELFDYGPYRFLPYYDKNFVAAYFDEVGLYSYGNQPASAQWNLAQLATAFLHITEGKENFLTSQNIYNEMINIIKAFLNQYENEYRANMILKLGVVSQGHQQDSQLINKMTNFMQESKIDYQKIFFDFYGGYALNKQKIETEYKQWYDNNNFQKFVDEIKLFNSNSFAEEIHSQLQLVKPASLLINEIEDIWDCISNKDDWEKFYQKINEIRKFRKIFLGY